MIGTGWSVTMESFTMDLITLDIVFVRRDGEELIALSA